MSADNSKIAMAAVAVASSLVIANIYHSAEKKRRSLSNERSSFDFSGLDLSGFLNAATSSLSASKQSSPTNGKQSPSLGLLELIPTEESEVVEVQSEAVQVQSPEVVQDLPENVGEEQNIVEESSIVQEQPANLETQEEEVVAVAEEETVEETVEEEVAETFESIEVAEEETVEETVEEEVAETFESIEVAEEETDECAVVEETIPEETVQAEEEAMEEPNLFEEVCNEQECTDSEESGMSKTDAKEVVSEIPEVCSATVEQSVDVAEQDSSVVISADLSQWEKIVTILLGTTSFFQKTVLVVALLVMFVHNTIG